MKGLNTLVALFAALALVATGCAGPQATDDEPDDEVGVVLEEEEDEHEHDEEHHEDEEDDQAGIIGIVAFAAVYSGDGDHMGDVEFTQTEDGVEVRGELESLDGGLRGFHVHEYGKCDPPDFESAGGHFNPTGHPHGGPDDALEERHAGDFGNLDFDDEENVAEIDFVDDVITVGSGTNNIVGHALIVHYDEDDLETQPTGDAGERAGCGIIEDVREGVVE